MQRNVLALATLLCAAALAMAGCGPSSAHDSIGTSAAGSHASTAASAVPKTSPKASPSPTLRPRDPGPRVLPIPPEATVVVASMVVQRLGVVTDRNMYGPVTVTDPARVSKIVALINRTPSEGIRAMRCPMQAGGGMTLVFRSSVPGSVVATVLINTSGCPGITVRPAAGGVVFLAGGVEVAGQVITILGVPWPKP